MKLRSKLAISLTLVLCLAVLAGCSNNPKTPSSSNPEIIKAQYDFKPYKDLNKMRNDAEMVFQGTVVKVNAPVKLVHYYISDNLNRPNYGTYTISDIKVEKVIKGDIKTGDIIQVKQLGGAIGEANWVSIDEPLLTEGTNAVFFTDPFKVEADYPPSILLFRQGIFEIDNGIIKPNDLQRI